MRILLYVIIAIFLSGCDSETDASRALRENIEKIKVQTKLTHQKTESLQQELKETWKNSLLYRFPNIQYINWEQEVSDNFPEKLQYLGSINFRSYKSDDINIVCNYKTDQKKVRPHFQILIFDANGINIHQEEVIYKAFLSHYIPVNKLTSQKVTLKLPKTNTVPTYFLLKEIEND